MVRRGERTTQTEAKGGSDYLPALSGVAGRCTLEVMVAHIKLPVPLINKHFPVCHEL